MRNPRKLLDKQTVVFALWFIAVSTVLKISNGLIVAAYPISSKIQFWRSQTEKHDFIRENQQPQQPQQQQPQQHAASIRKRFQQPTLLNSHHDDETQHECEIQTRQPTTSNNNHRRLRGQGLLCLVALLYGTLNTALRLVYALPGPPTASVLSATRGWMAAICFLPMIPTVKQQLRQHGDADADVVGLPPKQESSSLSPHIWKSALELAIWNFLAQGLLNIGLLYCESARASFLTQVSVVLTPIMAVVAGQKVKNSVWRGVFVAFAGLLLLSGGDMAGGFTTSSGGLASITVGRLLALSSGDLLVLGGALSWSIYLFRISIVSRRYPEIPLQAMKTTILAVLNTLWCLVTCFGGGGGGGGDGIAGVWSGWKNIRAWALLAFSAIGPGALADVLQQKGQKNVTATEANVILSTEPVFTAIFAYILLGEVTSTTEKVGGTLILLAAVLTSQ